jgi:hypothetical protein
MKFNFPRIELSPPQRLWLEEAYTRFKRGEEIRPKEMEIAMWGRVPKGFDPKTIDNRLMRGGYEPTLLGIWHVDPEAELLENTNKVIRGRLSRFCVSGDNQPYSLERRPDYATDPIRTARRVAEGL